MIDPGLERQGRRIAVIGAGPAGLMAAETLAKAGVQVTVYERMPSVGRKFLMAGRGGLNLTHSEPGPAFLARYGEAQSRLSPIIGRFPPAALVAWCEGLGQPTFVGSSGRVFPRAMKASPLLRAWLARLERLGVRIVARARWRGWATDGALLIEEEGAQAPVPLRPAATILALGGASWPRLGSDGGWVPLLRARGIAIEDLVASNAGALVPWSAHLRERFAGTPLKGLRFSCGASSARGEAVITQAGLEGGAVYALGAALRGQLAGGGPATLLLDLKPDIGLADLERRLAGMRPSDSLSTALRKSVRLPPVSIALLREAGDVPRDPARLAARIKALPLLVTGMASLDRAISSAGGVSLDACDSRLMLKDAPGNFVAGEMLDWDAPTGGYLLQASFATGLAAAEGALAWLAEA